MKRSIIIIDILLITLMAPLSGQVLNVSKISQKKDQWCWAGVSACILEFYGKSVSQCVIAEYTRTVEQFSDISFGNADCCLSPATCNNWNYNWGGAGSIEDILYHFANIATNNMASTISLPEITNSIAANRPFIIRWGWTTGGGHFIVGHGISGENIYYMNPWPGEGKKVALYSWVKSTSDHTWTHTQTLNISPRLPADAGTISGLTAVCQGKDSVTYKVPAIERALNYVWVLPDSTYLENTSDSITVTYSKDAVSGLISVYGKNNLGNGKTSTLPITVNPLPEDAGAITGPEQVCQRQRSVTYTVPEIKNADSYVWTVTADAVVRTNKNSITLDYGTRTGEGTISVKGKNDCGEGLATILNIELSGIPDTPVITQKGNDLTSSSPIGNQWYDSDGPIEGATLHTYTITKSDDYYVVVTINGCVSDPSEVLSLILNGIDLNGYTANMTMYPNPVKDRLEIKTEGWPAPVEIKISNSIGQVLYRSTFINHSSIDLSGYAPGIYLIRFGALNKTGVRKIIKE
jgi:hypothetical protein